MLSTKNKCIFLTIFSKRNYSNGLFNRAGGQKMIKLLIEMTEYVIRGMKACELANRTK